MFPVPIARHEAPVRASYRSVDTVWCMVALHKLRVIGWVLGLCAALTVAVAVPYAFRSATPVPTTAPVEVVCEQDRPCTPPPATERAAVHGETFSLEEFGSVRSITVRPLTPVAEPMRPRFTASWFDTGSVPVGRYELVLMTEAGKVHSVLLDLSAAGLLATPPLRIPDPGLTTPPPTPTPITLPSPTPRPQ